MTITDESITEFREYLHVAEKADNTILKYVHDVSELKAYLEGKEITKELLVSYKDFLQKKYQLTSANSMIAAVNCFLSVFNLKAFKLKQFKVQKAAYLSENRELHKDEYAKLIRTAIAKGKIQAALIMETIALTGIRVSELKYLSVESLAVGEFRVRAKGKERRVMIPKSIVIKLRRFCNESRIMSGTIFKNSRNSIWKMMKSMAKLSNIEKEKVFPHNLRHLFAKCFYEIEKDMAKLADVLGHTNINTTRIYLVSSGRDHRVMINKIGKMLDVFENDTC